MKRKVRKYICSAILILLIIWIVWGNVTVGVTRRRKNMTRSQKK